MTTIDAPTFGSHAVLVKKSINSLSALVLPPNIKLVNVDSNVITDFLGFRPPSHLETLIVSNNPIASLQGIPPMSHIRSITMQDTPFAKHPFYRIALVILFGRSLRVIDDDRISQSERDIAAAYPVGTTDLLRAGWIIKYPPPAVQEIVSIMATLAPPTETPKQVRGPLVKVPRAAAGSPRMTRAPRRTAPTSELGVDSVEEDSISVQEREIARLQLEILELQADQDSD
jgi:hypothetical protein